nr:helicase [Mesorhizobium albiziae]
MVANKYVFVALSIIAAIGPASALDVGLGGKVGGIGVGANLGLGKEGASVGGGAGVDNVGEATVGGSLALGKESVGASVGASGKLGGASGGLSAGVGSQGTSEAVGPSAGQAEKANSAGSVGPSNAASDKFGDASGRPAGSLAGSGPAGKNVGTAATKLGPTKGVRHFFVLPRTLWPSRVGSNKYSQGAVGYPLLLVAPLKAIPGTPRAVVRVCRQAIVSAATTLGAVRVRAASAGPLSRQRRGVLTAPIDVRIDYATRGGVEIRQARIRCRLDAAGRVIGVTG